MEKISNLIKKVKDKTNILNIFQASYYILTVITLCYVVVMALEGMKDIQHLENLSANVVFIPQILITIATFVLTIMFTVIQDLSKKYSDFKTLLLREKKKIAITLVLLAIYAIFSFCLFRNGTNIPFENILFYSSVYFVLVLIILVISASLLIDESNVIEQQKIILIEKINNIPIQNKYSRMPEQIIEDLKLEVEIINRISHGAINSNNRTALIEALKTFKDCLFSYFEKIDASNYDRFVEYVTSKYKELFEVAIRANNQALVSDISDSLSDIIVKSSEYSSGNLRKTNYIFSCLDDLVQYVIVASLNLSNSHTSSKLINTLIKTMIIFNINQDYNNANKIHHFLFNLSNAIVTKKELCANKEWASQLFVDATNGILNHVFCLLVQSYNCKGIDSKFYIEASVNNLTQNIIYLIKNQGYFEYTTGFSLIQSIDSLNLGNFEFDFKNKINFYSTLVEKTSYVQIPSIERIVDIFSFVFVQDLINTKCIPLSIYYLEKILESIKKIKIEDINGYSSDIYISLVFLIIQFIKRIELNVESIENYDEFIEAINSFVKVALDDLFQLAKLQVEKNSCISILDKEIIPILGILISSAILKPLAEEFIDKLILLHNEIPEEDAELHRQKDKLYKILKLVGFWYYKNFKTDTYFNTISNVLIENFYEVVTQGTFHHESDKFNELVYPELKTENYSFLIRYYLDEDSTNSLLELIEIKFQELKEFNEFLKI